MKLEIYADNPSAIKPPVALKLVEVEEGIEVVVVNAAGETNECGHLLRFDNEGTFYVFCGVDVGLGFRLDDSGRISRQ